MLIRQPATCWLARKEIHMNINFSNIKSKKYIGTDKFIAIISPLFSIKKQDYSIHASINYDSYFYKKYQNDFNCILMKNGYIDENYDYQENYTDYVPSLESFESHVNDLLNFPKIDEPEVLKKSADILNQRTDIVNMIYTVFADDDEFIDEITNYKVEYLIDKFHILFDITTSIRYDSPYVRIGIVNNFIMNEYMNEYEKILIELGFPPVSPGVPNTSGFITYLENYINKYEYSHDDFTFGEAFLRKIDEYIVNLDWFPHYE